MAHKLTFEDLLAQAGGQRTHLPEDALRIAHVRRLANGLLRHGEAEQVESTFRERIKLDLHVAHAQDLFLDALKGVTDPEKKRKTIGRIFIDVFAAEARKLHDCRFLAQGTLYPDVIESASPIGGPSAPIKSQRIT